MAAQPSYMVLLLATLLVVVTIGSLAFLHDIVAPRQANVGDHSMGMGAAEADDLETAEKVRRDYAQASELADDWAEIEEAAEEL